MADIGTIKKLVDANHLDYSLYTLARFIQQAIPASTTFDLWLIILVNLEISRGNVCLDLEGLAEKNLQLGWNEFAGKQECLQRITSSAVVASASLAGDTQKPLVFDLNKLYLNRFYSYERSIAERLLNMSQHDERLTETDIDTLDKLFGEADKQDYQKLAALVSGLHRLCIISGGPGTGKTWTVSKILAFLVMRQPKAKIKLAAPTGKAAARLTESIVNLQQHLAIDESIKQRIPAVAVTLHRLLAINRFTHQPRFNRSHKLDCDLVVVDEASMIDQQLMAQLCMALPDHARLILLGDKDQLSSVEAGSVFADLCGGLTETQFRQQQLAWCNRNWGYAVPEYQQQFALADQVVVLTKSHRFDDSSAIGQLAKLIKQGDSDNSMKILQQPGHRETLVWRQLTDNDIAAQLQQQPLTLACSMHQAGSISQAFGIFQQYQILCAVWKGAAGVDSINQQLEDGVKRARVISRDTELYPGKPLMMTSNAYQYDIHNGDIGIVWPDSSNDMKIWFQLGEEDYRVLSLSQCPDYKTAYAMTVHKAQGSEFEKVLLILPSVEVAVSTRELFYTGITRASKSVEIWASEDMIRSAIQSKTQRVSGLMQRLQKVE